MSGRAKIAKKLGAVFEPQQAVILAEVVTEAYSDLVKTGDFNELKGIVRELAEAQKRTEIQMEELAEAQKRTETRMEELAEAQGETAYQVRALTHKLGETNRTVGGLGRSFAYALENEAYRMMPAVLEKKHAIQVSERLVRTHIAGQEINLFGRGRQDGEDVLIVGETKLRLDERRRRESGEIVAFEQLEAKAAAVKAEYPDEEIVLVLITHYARPGALAEAQERGVIVVQSFEW